MVEKFRQAGEEILKDPKVPPQEKALIEAILNSLALEQAALPAVEVASSPVAYQAPTHTEAETGLPVLASRLSTATFHDYLIEGLKSRGQEIALPEPSAELVEVYNILSGEGYEVSPIAFVDEKKKQVRLGVFETVTRPDYTDGTQMYYSPRPDPLAGILKRGRAEGRIKHPYERVLQESRFAVSWNEIHDFVVPQARVTTPHLAEQLTKGKITLDIPSLADFQYVGEKLKAYSWEWVQDSAGFGLHHIVGGRGDGVHGWPPDDHDGGIGFRFEAVSRPQPLPR